MSAPILDLDELTLFSGAHAPGGQMCVMEAVAFVAGEPWSDSPKCVSRVLAGYARSLNDRLGDEDRQKLKVFIRRLPGTAGDGLDAERGFMAADWAIRVATPRWLDAAGLGESAAALRGLPRIVDAATSRQARGAARAARDEAWAARVRAREGLRARVKAELLKRGVTAAAAAVAVAAAVADAVAVAAAVADAVAVAVAVADAVAAAAAAAAADADAAAVADADAAAVAVAVAAADAGSTDYWSVYNAVYAKLKPIYQAKIAAGFESKYAEAARVTNAEAIALLGRMIDPRAEVV